MSVLGVNGALARAYQYANRTQKAAASGTSFTEQLQKTGEAANTSKVESESKTEIIVKPDGSRVLVITMSIGGMETTMSLEISKPTEVPTENAKQDTNHTPAAENDTVSDEMSDISSEV